MRPRKAIQKVNSDWLSSGLFGPKTKARDHLAMCQSQASVHRQGMPMLKLDGLIDEIFASTACPDHAVSYILQFTKEDFCSAFDAWVNNPNMAMTLTANWVHNARKRRMEEAVRAERAKRVAEESRPAHPKAVELAANIGLQEDQDAMQAAWAIMSRDEQYPIIQAERERNEACGGYKLSENKVAQLAMRRWWATSKGKA